MADAQAIHLLQRLASAYGPPGEEAEVRNVVAAELDRIGIPHQTDAKGSLLAPVGLDLDRESPKIIVTAHLDEIAMIVNQVRPDGTLTVGPLGGLFAWKLGEGPVEVLADEGPIPGVLGFGSIHSEHPATAARVADSGSIGWSQASVFTGLSAAQLHGAGVRPGMRVVVHRSRRQLFPMGEFIGGHFLDDRADLVAWLWAVEAAQKTGLPVLFAATAAEEVGGEGAQFILQKYRPDVCIALELGPQTPDAPIRLAASPTVWVKDSYSAMAADDVRLVDRIAKASGIDIQYQNLSRGGSDASCAASSGLCARPFTLGLPMENSHGYEIIHHDSMRQLGLLAAALLGGLS